MKFIGPKNALSYRGLVVSISVVCEDTNHRWEKPGDDGFIYSEGNKIGEVSLNVNVKLNHTQKMIWRAMGWR